MNEIGTTQPQSESQSRIFAPLDLTATLLDDLLGVWLRRKLVVILVVLGTILGAYAMVSYLSEQFEAEARLLVMLGRENTEVPITVDKGTVFTSGVQEEEVNSYIELLKSRELIHAAVIQVGLDRFAFELAQPESFVQQVKYHLKKTARAAKRQLEETLIRLDLKTRLTDEEKIIKLVQKSLSIVREGKSNVIHLSLRLPSDELASDTVEAILAEYFERHVALRKVANVVQVFDDQVRQYRSELERLQEVRATIREQWQISEVETQRAELLSRLSDLETSIDEQRSNLVKLVREHEALDEALVDLPERLVSSEVNQPNPAIERIKEVLIEMRLKRIETGSRYVDELPIIKSLDEAIAALDAELTSETSRRQGEVTWVPHPARLTLEQEKVGLQIEIAGLEASIHTKLGQAQDIESELQRLNEGEDLLHLTNLERMVVEQKYLANATRREEARIEGELDAQRVANVTVLSPPVASPEPVSPKKLIVMAVGVIVGLLLGIGLGLLLEWSDDTIHGDSDVARIPGLPYLGTFVLGAPRTGRA